MTTYNSIRPVNYLLYLIIFIISGCADNPAKYTYTNEPPTTVNQQESYTPKSPASNEDFISLKKLKQSVFPHKTIWNRLISLYALPDIENERVEKEIQNYLNQPEYLTTIQQRAEPFLYFILDQIESKQIPGELALLPVVESAFKPNAISKSSASGLWQFMPATGRLFGLKQNWWYDGRNDVYTSTQAATTYLKQLSELFDDDWFLALAAYNAGKGTIGKAIKRNMENGLATDYWSLALRKETMDYVPRLLAIAKIFANADKYNIPLQPFPNEPYFTVVNIESQLDLNLAIEMAQVPDNEFFTLNPAFKRLSTNPDGPFHLLIHTDKTETFKENLARIAKKDRIKRIRHQIKAGENLGVIARKYHTTVKALRYSNHLANNNIKTGQLLLISTVTDNAFNKTTKVKKQFYTVKKGDTFWNIARQFAVSSQDIANWNNLSLNKLLQPGQKLIIKKG